MQYSGRDPIYLFGNLPAGGTVSIQIAIFPGDVLATLTTSDCTETVIAGRYVWSTEDLESVIPDYPEQTTLLYVMTDALGNQFDGKVILNDFPEEVRRNYSNIQTLF